MRARFSASANCGRSSEPNRNKLIYASYNKEIICIICLERKKKNFKKLLKLFTHTFSWLQL